MNYPHSVTVQKCNTDRTLESAVTILAYMQPMAPDAVGELDLNYVNPYILVGPLGTSDANVGMFTTGSKVTWNSVIYYVRTRAMVHKVGSDADHFRVVVDEAQFDG